MRKGDGDSRRLKKCDKRGSRGRHTEDGALGAASRANAEVMKKLRQLEKGEKRAALVACLSGAR